MRIITICCFILASVLCSLSAQITIDIQEVSTCQNTVSVPVVILEDQVLTSIQFAVVWDGSNGTGLTFSGATDMIGNGSFGPNTDPAAGPPNIGDTLTYTWFDINGLAFTAGDQLITIEFDVNTPGDIYPVFFFNGPNSPSEAKATGLSFVPVSLTTLDGEVSSASNSPSFVDCPADITISNTDGTCSDNVSWIAPTVVDCDNNANTPTSTFSPGDLFNIGTQPVTYTVTDADGNAGTCTFNVTLTDGTIPTVACPPNINETLAVGNTYTATSSELMPTITDCSNTTINYTLSGNTQGSDIYSGQDLVFNIGTTQVLYTISDGINPPVDCNFSVTISQMGGFGITLDIGEVIATCGNDVAVPVIILEDQVVSSIDFTIFWEQPGLTFNNLTSNLPGGIVGIGPDPTPPHNNGLDTITYGYAIFPPIALSAGQTLVTLNFTPTGNAGDVIPVSFYPGTSHPDFPVPAEVSDASFNPILPVNTLNGSITIGTSDIFTIDCPANINLTDTDGDCSEIATWSPPVVNDCNNNSNPPTSNFDSGDVFGIGSQIITYTVTDADGNLATCSFTVNVTDGAAPDITCPANINETISAGSTYTASSAELMPIVVDCSNTTINYTLSGDTQGTGIYTGQDLIFNTGTTQVLYTISDGINPPVDCNFSVVVNEISPGGITLDIGDVTTTCNDDVAVPIVILEDQVITSIDFTIIWGQPGFTFNNLTSNLPGGIVGIGPDPTPPHNNGLDTITYGYAIFPPIALSAGQTLVTLNFTPTGNTGDSIPVLFYPGTTHPEFPVPVAVSDASFTPILPVNILNGSITIGGSKEVIINNCPGPVTLSCNDSTAPASTGMATATDGCGVSLTPDFVDVIDFTTCNNTGTITRTFTATDANSNENSCTQIITIIDETNPTFDKSPAPIANINCGDDLPTQETLTASDNCGAATVVPSVDPFNSNECDGYTITYRWIASDDCGNSTEITRAFEVNPDNVNPVTLCQSETNVLLDQNGNGILDPAILDNGSSDNCSVNLTFTASQTTFSCNDLGTQTVFLTIADNCGNEATCDATVSVIDEINPTLSCPENITLTTGNPSAVINDIGLENAADNCGISEINYTLSGATNGSGVGDASGTEFNTGQTIVTYTVLDISENSNSCSFTINLEGAVRIECPESVTASAIIGSCDQTINDIGITIVSDPQNITSVSYELSGATTGTGTDDASGTSFNVGMTQVTYTVVDAFDNTSSCTFDVVITDTENPVFLTFCPEDIVDFIGADCQQTINWTIPVVTDNCPGVELTSSHEPGSLFGPGETTVTYTATDIAGNVIFCSFTITLTDNSSPTINCPETITMDSPDGNPIVIIDIPPLSFNDNCPGSIVDYTLSGALSGSGTIDASGTAFPVGQTTVTYTTTDAAGNTGACSFLVDIQGALNIACPDDLTVDAGTDCTQIVDDVNVDIISDPENITSISYELNGATIGSGVNASGTIFNLGTTTVTYTVIDDFDNVVVCSFMVTVTDVTNPSITCPENIIQNTSNGSPVIITDIGPLTSNDNCGVGNITYTLTGATTETGVDDASGTSFMVGQTTVTYNIVDAAGNAAICDFMITINEETNNENLIDCPENIMLNVDPGLCSRTIPEITAIILINPDDLESIAWELSGSTTGNGTDKIENIAFNSGITEVTFNALDNIGNSDLCSFMVTINDNIPPVISGSGGFEYSTDADECGAIPDFNISITDNCEVTEILYELSGELNEFGSGIPSDLFFPTGVTTLTISATDLQNNSETYMATVTITDDVDPIATCPENFNLSVDIGSCQATLENIEGMKFDNCAVANDLYQISGATTASDLESLDGVALNIGENIIDFEIVDITGNTDACSFTITVINDQAPIIECPEDVFTNLAMGQTSAEIENIDPLIANNLCSDFVVFYSITGATTGSGTVSASGTAFNVGSSQVTYEITDAFGNTNACSFTVTVGNLLVECPENQTLVIPNDACEVMVNNIFPVTSNNNVSVNYEISGATITSGVNDASGTFFKAGISTIIYTITDDASNQAFCSFTITALDEQAPVITCPDLPIFSTDNEACTAFIPLEVLKPVVNEDNCDPSLNVEFEITGSLVGNGDINNIPLAYPVGTALITYTTSDESGNSASCSFTLEVVDNMAPAITCPDDTEISLPTGTTSAQIGNTNPSISDNCGIDEVNYTLSGATSGSGLNNVDEVDFLLGNTIVTYTVTDFSGNSNTCSFAVNVIQEMNEDLISCPINQISSTSPDLCSFMVENIAPTLLVPGDGIESITFLVTGATQASGTDDASGTNFNLGVSTVTYTANSANQDHQTVCAFTVTILDQEAPTWTGCPVNISVDANGEDCLTPVIWDEPVAGDNCGQFTIEKEMEPGSLFPAGTTTFNYTATDEAGNSSVCEINITVTDSTPPISEDCPEDVTITTDADNCGAIYNFNPPPFSDICSPVVVNSSHSSGELFPLGATTVTFTATDEAQNSSTCSFTITVIDQIPPTLTCIADVIINSDGTISSDPDNIIQNSTADGDCESVTIIFNDPQVADNCSSPIITTIGPGSGDLFSGTTSVTFQATDANENQSLACEFSVTILELPDISVDVNPAVACAGSTVTLTADPITGASYSWSGPNGFTATGSSVFINDLSPENIGAYQVLATLPGDCITNGIGTVTLAETPEITNLSSNGPICVGEELNFILTGNNLTLFEWEGPNNFSSSEASPRIENTTADLSGIYTVTVESATGCSNSATLEVAINGVPNPPSIQTDCENIICMGESCLLIGTSYALDPVYLWDSDSSNAGLPSITNNNEIVITPTEAGTYIYQYTVEVNDCLSPVTEYTVTVDAGPEAVDDLVETNYQKTLENILVLSNDLVTPGLGMSVNLLRTAENGNVIQNGDNTYSYTPNPDFIGKDEFTYQVCYVCSGTLICDEATVVINVTYTGDCDVPNVITPNGDNKNDVLFLPCITGDEFPDNQLTIYNQWGDEVFRQAPYQNQWDGTLKGEAGKDLPDGTYFFLFLSEQNAAPIKGHITIYR